MVIDKMLTIGLIIPVDEAEWISPTFIYDNKDSNEIQVCVDYSNLNNACVNDLFPTHFNDGVLENVGENEAYYFINGLLGYHQVCIAEEDKKKPMFTTEWGSYAYNVMPFGLNNAPIVFSHNVIAAIFTSSWKFTSMIGCL